MNTEAILIACMKAYVGLAPWQTALTQDQWKSVMDLSAAHRLQPLLYEVLKDNASLPPAFLETLRKEALISNLQDELQQAHQEELTRCLNQQGIPSFFFKGSFIKNVYHHRWDRWTSDVDVLIPEKHREHLRDLLTDRKYQVIAYGHTNHDIYQSPHHVLVEVHHHLFSINDQSFYQFFLPVEGQMLSGKELPLEIHALFVIVHFLKHLEAVNGAGIRLGLDVYLVLKTYTLDTNPWIKAMLKDLGLEPVYEEAWSVITAWFDQGILKGGRIEEKMIQSGLFGTESIGLANQRAQHPSRFKYLCFVLFPNLNYMQGIYPALKAYPLRLPWYWIRRYIEALRSPLKWKKLKDRLGVKKQNI